jgi:hypothetical protein
MNNEEASNGSSASEVGGKFYALPQLVRYEFEDGYSVTAPEGGFSFPGSIADTVGSVIDIMCKFFPDVCNPPSPTKPDKNCYTVTTPQGVEIRICIPA